MANRDASSTTDVLAVGAGPGGYAAAFRAADLGREVTLVSEDDRLGGVCLLRGCIPSKTLLSMTELIRMAKEAAEHGVSFGKPKIDRKKLGAWRDEVVVGLTDGLAALCKRRKIRVVHGRARFRSDGEVEVEGADGGRIAFEHAIVATGSVPVALPGTEFRENGRIMDSTGALALTEIPERLLVVGAGYVGLELGQVYARAGSEVTLVETEDGILPGLDRDLARPLADRLEQDFADLHFRTEVTKLEERNDDVAATLKGPDGEQDARFDRVLMAVGRRPNSDGLGLEEAGIELDEHGFVPVDERQQTAADGIFAIGDVTGGVQLAHTAMAQGKVAAEVIAGQAVTYDARAVPAVVYTDPQVAWCGLTEADAGKDGVRVAKAPWRGSGRARSIGAGAGLTKLLVDPDDGRILGMGVVGHDAEALIAEAVTAIEMGAVAEDLARIVHPHPTLSETVGEAAEAFLGMPTHLQPAKPGGKPAGQSNGSERTQK